MEKYRMLRQLLLEREVLMPAQLCEAPLAHRDELGLVHTGDYLEQVFGGGLDAAAQRRIGLPWSEELVLRSRASVGGTLAATREALERGISGNLAGGTHHAFADHGEGYCVFNDIAVAARVVQRAGAIGRAAVIDLDVHQGNGTAAIFADDETVFTFSIHGEKNFPFRKQRSHLDVGLADGVGDDEYLEALRHHLPQVIDRALPDLLFYQAGVDALAEDSLGRLSLTLAGLRARDRYVLETARAKGLPVVLTMGGGYARPISLTLEGHVGTYETAVAIFG
ncbi:histone deacetylase [Vulgatibacter sp.]|uniref:histone deacetylase family protein n=1 Tax=Vulgatibacter sp. TaxID=1971226 RepID=UPI00356A189F